MSRVIEHVNPKLALVAAAGTIAALLLFYQLARLDLLFLSLPLLFGIVAALLLARYPWAGFGLLIMSVPVQRLGAEGGGLPITLTQIAFPLALAGLAVTLVATQPKLRGHVLLVPFAILFVLMLASALTAASAGSALSEIARWTVALVAFWLALQFVLGESQRRLVAIVALLVFGGVFEATIGVVQSVFGFGPFQLESGVSRAFGTFGKPNSFAGYLEMTLFPAIWLGVWYIGESLKRLGVYRRARLLGMESSRKPRRDVFASVAMAVFLVSSTGVIFSGILASLSRGAWLGVAIGLLVTTLLFSPLARILTLLLAAVVAGIVLSGQTWLVPDDLRDRIADSVEQIRPFDVSNVPITDENFAAAERVAHWQAGIDMFRDHPALGVGVGNYNTRFEEYAVRQGFRTSQGHAHNYYIHTLAETGLAGLLAYLTLLGTVIALALRVLLSRTQRGTVSRAIVLGAFGSIVAISIHNLFENLHVLNLGIIISLLWALVIAGHERWRMESFAVEQRAV